MQEEYIRLEEENAQDMVKRSIGKLPHSRKLKTMKMRMTVPLASKPNSLPYTLCKLLERIDDFNLIDEALFSEYDEEIVSRFNDLFNIIHLDDSKLKKDNDDNDIDIIQSSEGFDTILTMYTDLAETMIWGEYMSQEFLDHLKDHGIIAHRTPPYTPQHNGVSERRNRTLLDMVRSMMSQTTLTKSFWDYALETAVRILNMVPTKKVEKTPYEVWHGQAC
ncbi:retrotransposon protein, putative, ty1-copia subclass [Tanacetum coccineum]